MFILKELAAIKNNDTTAPQGAIAYAWFVWDKIDGKFNGPTILDWITY